MYNNDRYYEPEDDDSDLIEEYIHDLMQDEYNPTKYKNFAEAISEAKEADRLIIEEMLQKPVADRDYAAIGRKLFDMAYSYMEGYAENHAMSSYENGYLND
jgi:hypothetical protein